MKIGAGGLQSLLTYDAIAVRKVDPAQVRPGVADEQHLVARQVVGLDELVRLVEQLNRMAGLSNYPFRFRVRGAEEDREREEKRGGRDRRWRLELVDGRGRHQRFLADEELDQIRRTLDENRDEAALDGGLGLNTEV